MCGNDGRVDWASNNRHNTTAPPQHVLRYSREIRDHFMKRIASCGGPEKKERPLENVAWQVALLCVLVCPSRITFRQYVACAELSTI